MRGVLLVVGVLAFSPQLAAGELQIAIEHVEGKLSANIVANAIELDSARSCFAERDESGVEVHFSVLSSGQVVGRKVLSDVPSLTRCVADKLTIKRLPSASGTTKVSARIGFVAAAPVPAELSSYLRDIPGPATGKVSADIVTNYGTIECTLYPRAAPRTVANFVGLARGLKTFVSPKSKQKLRRRFYDGLTFHRVIPDFMIQGGDPTGSGRGGPGYKFDHEDNQHRFDRPGVLAMANAGKDTNGSQFFITEKKLPHLDGKYTIFGQCQNQAIVKRIARLPTHERSRPKSPVTIKRVRIYRR